MRAAAVGLIVTWAMLIVVVAIGWVMNLIEILRLAGVGFDGNETEIIIRCIGIVAVPVGGVMGWF